MAEVEAEYVSGLETKNLLSAGYDPISMNISRDFFQSFCDLILQYAVRHCLHVLKSADRCVL